MKKRHVSAVLTFTCVIIVSLLVCVSASAAQRRSSFYLWGQLEKESQGSPVPSGTAEPPAIVGGHFSISADELNRTIDVQELIDPASAETAAKQLLIERYSLYYQAEQEGCVVTDEYIDDLIKQEISMFAEGTPNNSDYEDFLAGLGMTNEEYWYSCRDMLKMTASIGNWKQKKYDEFISENGFDMSPPEDLDALWAEHLNALTAEIIAREHIKTV